MNILCIFQKVFHIHNKACCNKTLETSVLCTCDDQITKVSCCRSCLEKCISAACNVRSDNIQLHIKFIFYDLCKPSGLDSLIVGCTVKYIYCDKILILGICRSTVITVSGFITG